MLGADWSRGRATVGLILGHSLGNAGYRGASGGGTVSLTLTGLYPLPCMARTYRLIPSKINEM